jgi:hypothetical protein
MKPKFLVITDRGQLKAYQLAAPPGQSSTPRLVAEHRIEPSRGKFDEKVTDQAGAFPSGHAAGTTTSTSSAERLTLEAENERRSFREIGAHISRILAAQRPDTWAFAAPSEINRAILDEVPKDLKDSLAMNVPRDLVHTPDGELLAHFRQV